MWHVTFKISQIFHFDSINSIFISNYYIFSLHTETSLKLNILIIHKYINYIMNNNNNNVNNFTTLI